MKPLKLVFLSLLHSRRKQNAVIISLWCIFAFCIVLYLTTHPLNPNDPNSLSPDEIQFFQLHSIKSIDQALTISISYNSYYEYPPQYVLPHVTVELNSSIGKFIFNYKTFQNQEVVENKKQILFQIYPHASGINTATVKILNQTIGETKLQLDRTVHFKASSSISILEQYSYLRNICIDNGTIIFFTILDFEPNPYAKLLEKPINTTHLSIKEFYKERKPALIKNNSYYVLSSTASDFIYSIINLPINQKYTLIYVPLESYNSSFIAKINNTKYIEEPICFKTLYYSNNVVQSFTDMMKLNLIDLQRNDVEQKKIVADSKIAERIDNSIPLYSNASFQEAFNILSDAKVYVGSSIDSYILTNLMSDDETAFFDVSDFPISKDYQKIIKHPKLFKFSPTLYDDQMHSIDWYQINNMISSIITNSEDSPLLMD